MEIQYHGANCIRITTKKATVTIDDNLKQLGAKPVSKPGDILLYTNQHDDPEVEAKIVIDQAGEYEVSDCSIQGIMARAHMDEDNKQTATIFRVIAEDIRIAVVGHVFADLHEDQLETLGIIDVLLIPVGGNGYTLDGVDALKLIKEIEPKIIIPTHYADGSLKYEVPQQTLDEAVKGLAMEPKETLPKLKLKSGELADITQLIVLERQ